MVDFALIQLKTLTIRSYFRFFVIAATLLSSTSCVINRKYQMLQKHDVNKSNLPADSVMRSYVIEKYDYKVQTNDIISVRWESLSPREFDFFSSPSGTASVSTSISGALLLGDIVDENGEIPVAVIGKVKVAGLTIFEIQDMLQKLAKGYLESPLVKVRLLNFRVTFLGEVAREGVVTITNNRVSMLEAIALAGGFTDLADRSNIKLIRQNGSKSEVVYINVLDESFVTSPYYYVHQNDIIISPPLKLRPYVKYSVQNLSLLLTSMSLLIIVLTYTK
ncbi:polysaccharide biosynthesis/export family protein [soil metagenome]